MSNESRFPVSFSRKSVYLVAHSPSVASDSDFLGCVLFLSAGSKMKDQASQELYLVVWALTTIIERVRSTRGSLTEAKSKICGRHQAVDLSQFVNVISFTDI